MLRFITRTPSGQPDGVPLPTVVLLHGRGADMHDLADLAPLLDPPGGARFVFANAPKPFEPMPGMSFGWTWFEGWPPSHDSVIESRALLLEFLEQLPEGKLIVGGFSQGAMMALDAGLRMQRDVAGILAFSGGLYEPDLPDLSRHKGLPVFIGHGTLDDVVPVNYARRARRVLEDAGLDVTYHEYPMGHQIVMEEMEIAKTFIASALR